MADETEFGPQSSANGPKDAAAAERDSIRGASPAATIPGDDV
jgi:hypothetical protein